MDDEGDASRRPLTHGSSLSQGTNDNSNAKNNDKANNNGDGGAGAAAILVGIVFSPILRIWAEMALTTSVQELQCSFTTNVDIAAIYTVVMICKAIVDSGVLSDLDPWAHSLRSSTRRLCSPPWRRTRSPTRQHTGSRS